MTHLLKYTVRATRGYRIGGASGVRKNPPRTGV
jgi:hypothetical protein